MVQEKILREAMNEEEGIDKRRMTQEETNIQMIKNDHMATIKGFTFELLHLERDPSQQTPVELNLIQSLMLPWELKRKIDDMGGRDIKLVIQKTLRRTDLSSSHNRLSIPENNIKEEAIDFLEKEEKELLKIRDEKGKLEGLPVLVLDSSLEHYNLALKRWEMKTSFVYNLTKWNLVVKNNNLQPGDKVELWSFRTDNNQLCFAFVKL